MKKIVGFLVSLLVLAALYASGGCSGANDVVGPGNGDRRVTPVTPHPPSVTPVPPYCQRNPGECD